MINSNSVDLAGLIKQFSDRVEPWRLDSILDYIAHNEIGMALEYLVDHILENNIMVSQGERREITRISHVIGMYTDSLA